MTSRPGNEVTYSEAPGNDDFLRLNQDSNVIPREMQHIGRNGDSSNILRKSFFSFFFHFFAFRSRLFRLLQRYADAALAVIGTSDCLSVRLSCSRIVSKRLKTRSSSAKSPVTQLQFLPIKFV